MIKITFSFLFNRLPTPPLIPRNPESWWDRNATIEDWFDEMVGQANIINRFGGVKMEDLRGVRVPFLKPGWNRQFLMMKEFGFVYGEEEGSFQWAPLLMYKVTLSIAHLGSVKRYADSCYSVQTGLKVFLGSKALCALF